MIMRRLRRLAGLAPGLILIASGSLFAETDSQTVQVTATILPRLELTVSPETGDAIAFGAIRQPDPAGSAARTVKVSVNVFSNLGRPYHVTQLVRQPLSSRTGAVIPDGQFLVSAQDASRGELGPVRPAAVVPGLSTTLYRSDSRGKSDAFRADYTLNVTSDTPAGDFQTEIVYTVTSL
jgi:hypothetical protein